MGLLSKRLKNEFETAVINEPSVFEPLKVYCNYACFNRLRVFNITLHILAKYDSKYAVLLRNSTLLIGTSSL